MFFYNLYLCDFYHFVVFGQRDNFNKVREHNLFQNLLWCIFIFDRVMLLRPPNTRKMSTKEKS